VEHLIGIFGWLMPGEIKAFTLEEVQAAIAWAAA
jgi:hypothetical protein